MGSFNESNYYYLIPERTFNEAKELAERFNADLLTITSQGEQDYIYQSLSSNNLLYPYWLGLTDDESEGVWKWLNGEEYQFSNWAPNEPNNSGV